MARNSMSSLEDRLNELEKLTSSLENGQLNMDAAIAAYAKGMQLALSCKKTLDEMTQKVEQARAQAAQAQGISVEEMDE